ncbi:hypothetical protein [Bradyrhizobium sp. CCBAU 65884]|uniref:hypothetical protein n=1 Tax=Bradyrhizobium sp. CCBAU 65884 TaxID=722477 RepID=UPI002306D319|nr:hypothetical protein [Bradyrhizobium sp. CCBAU 65884]
MPKRPSLLSLVFCGGALLILVPAVVTATIYTTFHPDRRATRYGLHTRAVTNS